MVDFGPEVTGRHCDTGIKHVKSSYEREAHDWILTDMESHVLFAFPSVLKYKLLTKMAKCVPYKMPP